MKLSVDDQGRLLGADLFRPNSSFEVTIQPDGSILLVELKPVPVLRPRRLNGRLRGAETPVDRQTVAAAVRADRDAR